jgi:hypothetical protein
LPKNTHLNREFSVFLKTVLSHLNMWLVIWQSKFKISSGADSLQITSHCTMGRINNILRSTSKRKTNTIRPTSGGWTERPTGDEKVFTTITPLGRACKATFFRKFWKGSREVATPLNCLIFYTKHEWYLPANLSGSLTVINNTSLFTNYLTNIRRSRIELAIKGARSTLVPTLTPTRLLACHAPAFSLTTLLRF